MLQTFKKRSLSVAMASILAATFSLAACNDSEPAKVEPTKQDTTPVMKTGPDSLPKIDDSATVRPETRKT